METRSRSKRAQPTPSPRAAAPPKRQRVNTRSMRVNTRSMRVNTRSMRVNTRSMRAQAEKEDSHAESDKESGSHSGESQDGSADTSLARKFASRRGAPVPVDQASSSSLQTPRGPHGGQRSSSAGEEEDEEQQGVEGGVEGGAVEDEAGLAVKRQVMQMSLPDLSQTTSSLVSHLRGPRPRDTLHRYLLKAKRSAFYTMREVYQDPPGFPFIDQPWLIESHEKPSWASSTIASANIASALDLVESILEDDDSDVLEMLVALDDFLYKLLVPYGDAAQNLALALDIRTLRTIGTLVKEKPHAGVAGARTILTSIFCEFTPYPGKIDYAAVLSRAPRKPLSHREADDVDEACFSRIEKICSIINRAKTGEGVGLLQEMFSPEDILARLRDWILGLYDGKDSRQTIGSRPASTGAPKVPIRVRPERPPARSPPIVRDNGPRFTSFFTGPESLAILRKTGEQRSVPSPSSRQRRPNATPPSVRRSEGNHVADNASTGRPATVVDVSPLPRSGDQPPRLISGPESHASEPQLFVGDVDDDNNGISEGEDGDSEFEQDNRQVDRGKSAAISHTLKQSSTRPAPVARPPSSTAHAATASSRPRTNLPHSSAPAVAQRPRSTQSARERETPGDFPDQRRYPFSRHDTDLLIRLVYKHDARWSAIEKEESWRFERPRNQQAYRDKARNLKVDFLLEDAPLPPGFDRVALGKKEVDRLVDLGKNPSRKEDDVDDYGRPVNTDVAQ